MGDRYNEAMFAMKEKWLEIFRIMIMYNNDQFPESSFRVNRETLHNLGPIISSRDEGTCIDPWLLDEIQWEELKIFLVGMLKVNHHNLEEIIAFR